MQDTDPHLIVSYPIHRLCDVILNTGANYRCLCVFSSRRRHTRFDCGWSSDVCSSDLLPDAGRIGGEAFEHRADVVLLTTPTFVTRRLAEWPDEWSRRLDDWTYRTAVVLLLELRRPFSDTYWINIADREIPFIGLIEHTNLVPAERYPARYLYVSNYVARDDSIARMSTDELFARYLPSLRRINPRWSDFDVMRRWSFREEAAQPIPRVRNRQRLLPFTSPRRGLFIVNTTQIYPEDRGTNYSAR